VWPACFAGVGVGSACSYGCICTGCWAVHWARWMHQCLEQAPWARCLEQVQELQGVVGGVLDALEHFWMVVMLADCVVRCARCAGLLTCTKVGRGSTWACAGRVDQARAFAFVGGAAAQPACRGAVGSIIPVARTLV